VMPYWWDFDHLWFLSESWFLLDVGQFNGGGAYFQEVLLNPYMWTPVEKWINAAANSPLPGLESAWTSHYVTKTLFQSWWVKWCDSVNIVIDMPLISVCFKVGGSESSGSLVFLVKWHPQRLHWNFWLKRLDHLNRMMQVSRK
jgi:hypothetical protein